MIILENAIQALPVVTAHLAAALVVFAIGMFIYKKVTPYHELQLIREGNDAAGTALLGALIGMALPIAAALNSGLSVLDIMIWAGIAVIIQLASFFVVDRLLGGLREPIEQGVVAAGLKLCGTHIAVGLITAAAIAT